MEIDDWIIEGRIFESLFMAFAREAPSDIRNFRIALCTCASIRPIADSQRKMFHPDFKSLIHYPIKRNTPILREAFSILLDLYQRNRDFICPVKLGLPTQRVIKDLCWFTTQDFKSLNDTAGSKINLHDSAWACIWMLDFFLYDSSLSSGEYKEKFEFQHVESLLLDRFDVNPR